MTCLWSHNLPAMTLGKVLFSELLVSSFQKIHRKSNVLLINLMWLINEKNLFAHIICVAYSEQLVEGDIYFMLLYIPAFFFF